MFGNLGLPEILIILLIVLLLFGAKRIPEVAGSLGKGINEFKRNMSEAQRAITSSPPEENRNLSSGDRIDGAPVDATAEKEPAREPKRLLG
jgi:sec-independent protein translocase protein TatA